MITILLLKQVAIIRKAWLRKNTSNIDIIRANPLANFPGVTSGRVLFQSMGAMKDCKCSFADLNILGTIKLSKVFELIKHLSVVFL